MNTPVFRKWAARILGALTVVSLALVVSCEKNEGEKSSPKIKLKAEINQLSDPDSDLIIKYNQPVIREREGVEIFPELTFSREVSGSLSWDNARTLRYTFDPGQISWGSSLRVQLGAFTPEAGADYMSSPQSKTLSIPRYSAAGKVATWESIPGKPRFIAPLTMMGESDQIGTRPYFLLFDQPLDLDDLKSQIKLTYTDGTPVDFVVEDGSDVTDYFDVSLEKSHIAAIKLYGIVLDEGKMELTFPSWDNPESSSPKQMRFNLEINRTFLIETHSFDNQTPSGAYNPGLTAKFRVNNGFDAYTIMDALEIEPKPKDIYFSSYWDNEVRVRLSLEIGETYTMRILAGSLVDNLGNPLSQEFYETIRVRDEFPNLTVPQYALTTEVMEERIPVKTMNVDRVTLKVRTFPGVREYIKALALPHKKSAQSYGLSGVPEAIERIVGDEESLNSELMSTLAIGGLGGPSAYKLVELSAHTIGSEGGSTIEDTVLYHSTDIGLAAKVYEGGIMVWAAALSSAEPVENASLALYDKNGNRLTEGVTDGKGIAYLNTTKATLNGVSEQLYVEAKKDDMVSLMRLVNGELSAPWQFQIAGATSDSYPLYGSIFTERGVYRPQDKVYIKSYIFPEERSDAQYNIKVINPRGKNLLDRQAYFDEFNAADFEVDIPANGATGKYDIIISNGSSSISGQFTVEEYRVPSFVVDVESATREWQNGSPLTFHVNAHYYNGGKMDAREIKWNVFRSQAPMILSQYPGFIFQTAHVFDSTGPYQTDSGVLNAEGDFTASFTPSHNASAGRLRYTFEAVVTDIDRQAYSGRTSGFIHPAQVYVGVKPPAREVVKSGSNTEVPLVLIDTEGAPQKGTVNVTVDFIENHTSVRLSDAKRAQMFNHRVSQKVEQDKIQLSDQPETWTFTPEKAGIYRLSFSSRDADGVEVVTYFYMTVTGDETTAWPRFDAEQIEVIRDKESYRVGDVAVLVPEVPYDEATGLLTIERDGIRETSIFQVTKNTPGIEIPITEDMAPNVFASLVIVRGRIHSRKDASGYETGAPGLKVGYTTISVQPEEKELTVSFDTNLSSVSPGQKIALPVKVTDNRGNPAAAQLTVMVVDEAVLDMTNYITPNPLYDIYVERPLGVRTGANWLDLPHSRRERLEKIFPDGGGDDMGLNSRSDLEKILRNLFKSTAYWNPRMIVGEDGSGLIEFTMPDNLTEYRVMVVAADKESRFGSEDYSLINQRKLMVQPVIPRFAYPEDDFSIEALIINNGDTAGTVDVKLELEGLKLTEGSHESKLTLAPGESKTVSFPVRAEYGEEAKVRFFATLGSESDGGEFTLPLLNPGIKVSRVESVSLSEDATVTLDIPSEYLKGTLTAEAVSSKTPLTELKDSVQYLMRYPYGCIEQTTSTAYPLVVLDDLLPIIGVEVDRAQLKEYADAGIARILSFQTDQGGLSYWPDGKEPHAFATAFGLTALLAARDKGYDIPADALSGMADYLELTMRSGKITGEMPHGSIPDGDTRALFVMTLGRLGRPQPQYINALWEKREELTPFGLSFLAIAVEEMDGGNKALLQPILEEIKRRAVVEPEEAYFEGKREGGWSMGSPLRTQGGALVAYGVTKEDGETGQKVLKGLLERRRGGLWGNTQENVFGIMGVYELVANGGKNAGAPAGEEWNMIINDRVINPAEMEAPDMFVRRINLVDSELNLDPSSPEVTLKAKGSGGFLTLRLNYELPLSLASFEAEENGFSIERRYETLEGKSLEGKEIPLGSLVQVKLKIDLPSDRHYVALDDKLPAGLEPLNSALSTTETVSRGELSKEEQKGLSVLSYSELRDSRVLFFADEMLAGTYEYSYVARATTPGRFLRPAARVEAMYEPEINGLTEMDFVEIR
ncbi:MAG: alpha-2-macroglobulin family protein [Spirochaetales bacterium]|nr:alpha-2-macroglobulin family protein [Spirochaetales bacterium]